MSRWVATAACSVVFMSACQNSAPAGSEATLDDVYAQTFTSTSVREGSSERPLASEQPITLSFTEDGISVTAGCNTLFGAATIDAGRLILTSPLASTLMACDESLMQQDQWLNEFLSASPMITKDGDALTLTSDDESIALQVLETTGLYDTPVFGPEELPRAQALCDQLVADGATLEEARAAAENRGYIFRIAMRDGESLPEPSDINAGRIRVDVIDDLVKGCTAG